MHQGMDRLTDDTTIKLELETVTLEGLLAVPPDTPGIVLFAHGSGSSRHSPRNNFVAEEIQQQNIGTLLFDLLTEEEDRDRQRRFDIELLTERLLSATKWVRSHEETAGLSIGYFGSSTGAAAALKAAASKESAISAIVSRGGRVDLAADVINTITAPTLFIVGGADTQVLELNKEVFVELQEPKDLHVVADAGHLFDGPGELEEVAQVAASWFSDNLI